MTALLLDQVTKRFGNVTAVNDLSFAVPEGEVYGFLGGNGAGKTTSLRMVLDIIRPTAGRIEVLGKAPGRENSADLGFLPEERGLYKTMSAIDTIVYFGRLKGMSAGDARAEGERLLERFGLSDFAKTNVDKLSKGMAQKVQLATAVVNKPRLLILDEPFSGLDPVNQGLLEDEIRRASQGGATVVFSTHVMQHAERLCDRLLLLAKGAKRFEGTLDEARAELPARLTILSREAPNGLPGVARATMAGPAEHGWTAWAVEMEQGRDPGDLLEACTQRGFALRGFEQHKPSLHDVFIHIVGAGEARA
ncbi:ABC transporter ATP-binding protein [Sphingosinithalassobacter portus]|uniref:ABC transporter ATP-binding protein n=1 Tax=Stakelama portus TaxID=2676234 RepID=UPI000D6E32A4|nr:ATP-binding cassette domain-containing protein [Sphingosinithalassobacter portus]